MLPSDVAIEVLWYGFSAVGLIAAASILGALARRRGGRPSWRWLPPVLTACFGFGQGYAILLGRERPELQVAALATTAAAVFLLVSLMRLNLAGVLVGAVAVPWTLYFGGYLADDLFAGGSWPRSQLNGSLAIGLAALIGGAVAVRVQPFRIRVPASDPAAPPARRFDTLGWALLGPTVLGVALPNLALLTTVALLPVVLTIIGHGRPISEAIAIGIVGSVLAGIAATAAWVVAWIPRFRRAYEAFAWAGEHDFDRFRKLNGGSGTPTVDEMRRYVRNRPETPEDRWLRAEALLVDRKFEEAREVAARIPADDPVGRAHREDELAYVDWVSGGDGNTTELRAAVRDIQPGDSDERLRAEVHLALAVARQRLGRNDTDPLAPVREVRDRLGSRADGIVVSIAVRRRAAGNVRTAALYTFLLMVVDRISAT